MVNNTIVSRFTGPPLPHEVVDRKLSGGPLYPPSEVLDLLDRQGNEAVRAWSRDCIRDVQKLDFVADDLAELIAQALQDGRFLGSEWCVQKPEGPWAACDAYSLRRQEWIEAAAKHMSSEYYIKFAISKTGLLLFLASCHLSRS